MAKTQSIPKEIKEQVSKIVDDFNEENQTTFKITFRRQFAYLAKTKKQLGSDIFRELIAQKLGIPIEKMPEQPAQIIETKLGRLKYCGQMDNWKFAVFKYSRETYDAEDWLFPGSMELDGTIEGALRAGMNLYK